MAQKSRNCVSLAVSIMALVACLAAFPGSALAQDQIFGSVHRSDQSVPANGEMKIFAFINGADQEVKTIQSTGLGYDNGFWLDDFRNYGGSQGGQPYDHFFFNPGSGEGFHLAGTIPTFDITQEDITLGSVSWPAAPVGLAASAGAGSDVELQWTAGTGLTYHVYRRLLSEPGSFFRIDEPSGSLANRGVSGGTFIDATAATDSAYQYMLVAENDAGLYSTHSAIVTYDPLSTSCCIGFRGNVNGDPADIIEIVDIVYLVAFMFKSGAPSPCPEEANVNGSADGLVDIADLVILVQYSFNNGPEPAPCP
jgi:hypothetical protein